MGMTASKQVIHGKKPVWPLLDGCGDQQKMAAAEGSEISALIDCLQKRWSSSENDEVVKAAKTCLVNPILASAAVSDSSAERPQFTFEKESPILRALAEVWPLFGTWKSIVPGVRVCHLWTNIKDEEASWRILHMEEGVTFPQHSYDCPEILHVLCAAAEAEMGQCEQWLRPLENDSFHLFYSTAPKMIKSGRQGPLLALSMLKRSSPPRILWPDEKCGRLYGSNLMDVQGSGLQSVSEYYDKLAIDYDEAVRAWGYCLPEACAEVLIKYGGLKPGQEDVTLLDLGCGNGLCGQALSKQGLKKITGLDISQKSLDVASQRSCYFQLLQADLLAPLPFSDGTFHYLICIGVTSYLEPRVLSNWLDVVKPGGVLCFSVKTSCMGDWEPEQLRLQQEGRWRPLWTSPDIAYLPNLRPDGLNACTEFVKLYMYRKA